MSFYTDVIAKDKRFHSTAICHDLALLEPVTRQNVLDIIAEAKRIDIDLMPFETYRSTERQLLLFEQGATKLKSVGVHHYGLACDLVRNVGGAPSWKGSFEFLVGLGKRHGMISGNDWGQPKVRHSFIDADHVQRITLARQPSLFAGAWYPAPDYDPYRDG